MSWYEVAFGPHYPLLYAHRDAAEAARAVALVGRLAPLGQGPLLDLGCGAGRHLPHLAARGAPVIGLDLSLPLLRAAEREVAAGGAGERVDLVRGDMRALPLRDGSVAAVLSLFTSFGYFGALPAHGGMLAEVARVLAPGGRWVLDYLNCAAVRRELAGGDEPPRRRRIGPLEATEARRLAADRVIKDVVLRPAAGVAAADPSPAGIPPGGLAYTEEVALFDLEELDELAGRNALERVAAAGDYAGAPLKPDSPRWILVYRRETRGRPGR